MIQLLLHFMMMMVMMMVVMMNHVLVAWSYGGDCVAIGHYSIDGLMMVMMMMAVVGRGNAEGFIRITTVIIGGTTMVQRGCLGNRKCGNILGVGL